MDALRGTPTKDDLNRGFWCRRRTIKHISGVPNVYVIYKASDTLGSPLPHLATWRETNLYVQAAKLSAVMEAARAAATSWNGGILIPILFPEHMQALRSALAALDEKP